MKIEAKLEDPIGVRWIGPEHATSIIWSVMQFEILLFFRCLKANFMFQLFHI